jgi:hypothetical protein
MAKGKGGREQEQEQEQEEADSGDAAYLDRRLWLLGRIGLVPGLDPVEDLHKLRVSPPRRLSRGRQPLQLASTPGKGNKPNGNPVLEMFPEK